MTLRLAILGFGTVGQGFVEILVQRRQRLEEQYGTSMVVVAISDLIKGSLYQPEGLDLAEVLNAVETVGNLGAYPDQAGLIRGLDSLQTIRDTVDDTLIEATITNVQDGQPGLNHCREALRLGKNVITTNKGPIALALPELESLAAQQGVRILYEGTVMSGTPVIRLASATLAGNQISGVRGILNGTCNYMLTRMEAGLDFDEALAEAQKQGYAEADPTNDVDGYDAQYKVMILAQALFGARVSRQDVPCTGIRGLTHQAVAQARREGQRYKLVASLQRTTQGVKGYVQPELLPDDDPLAGVRGATNALTFRCDLLGDVTIMGAGAGRRETGFALLADCLNLSRGQI